jgi:hypothetical protein
MKTNGSPGAIEEASINNINLQVAGSSEKRNDEEGSLMGVFDIAHSIHFSVIV